MKRRPKENHSTAAWAGIKSRKKRSKVPVPSEFDVAEAKRYVDKNEK